MEAALLAHGGDVNATAAALVLGADARAEVWGQPITLAALHRTRAEGVLFSSCKPLRGGLRTWQRCV